MKKVLFIGPSFYNLENQGEIKRLEEKFKGLSSGAEVFVLSCGKPFHQKIWGSEFYLLKRKTCFLLFAFWLGLWICQRKKIEVIVAQSPLLEGYFASLLARIFKKELIIEVHGDWEAVFLVKKRRFEALKKKAVKFFVKKSFQRTDKVRVVAGYLAQKARAIQPKARYYNFPTYTNLDIFFKEENRSFQKYLLFVGALYKIKGVEHLIEAFSLICNSVFDFKLKIVGKGPQKESLENQAEKLGIASKVEFLGKLSLEETKNQMKDCFLLCLPSLSEGLPRVIMEAMALAKPVVASCVGGIPEIVKDNQTGFLFEKGNPRDLSDKLSKLLSNDKLAFSMGEKARSFAQENFSVQSYLRAYLAMLND